MRTHVYPRRSREQREEQGRERPPCLPVQQVAAWRFALVYHALVTHAALFSILLLWPTSVHAEKNLVRPPGTTRYKTMVRELNALVKYDKTREKRMTLSSLGHSVRGRDLWMVTLGSGPKRIFYLCRQHGHEPASTEGALAFIGAVVKADTDTPTANCLESVTVYVVPMANPDGAEAFLRHNAHDADINRDWITRGEPETKAIILNADASAVDMDSLELESQPGVEASPRSLQSAVGLVWRALLLWMLLLLLLSFSMWL